MKCFGRLFRCTLLAGLVGLIGSVGETVADPTDDFSMSLKSRATGAAYRVISEDVVTRILSDKIRTLPASEAPRLAKHVLSHCERHRLDPAMVLSLIDVESRFRPRVVSPAGAIGLMQVMVPTAAFVLRELMIHDSGYGPFNKAQLPSKVLPELLSKILKEPYANTAIGIAYLAWLRDYYEGKPPYYVLAAYNVGPAKLDELLLRKSFRPVQTKKYYTSILRRVHSFRDYGASRSKSVACPDKNPVM